MKKIFLHARPFLKNTSKLEQVSELCQKKGLEVFVTDEAADHLPNSGFRRADFSDHFDFGVTFGGDGTVLGALRKMRDFSSPILPISAGSLGFLAEIPPEGFENILDAVLENRCKIDERAMLRIDIPEQQESFLALNEVVLGASGEFRMAKIRSFVDGDCLTVYRSDGVMVATPTGSTAYALSAGGPLVYPAFEAMILLPISPHSFTQKPLVLPRGKKISLVADAKNFSPLLLAIDGQKIHPIEKTDRIEISLASEKTRFLRLPEEHYFKTIRRKLFWGAGNGEGCEISEPLPHSSS